MTVAALGGGLKTKQKITGRLADALSELYMLSCVLKRYEDDGKPTDDRQIVSLCAQNALYRHQQALRGAIDNFPVAPVRWLMNWCVFPLGARYRPAPDWLGHKVVELVLQPGEVRDRLTRHIYISRDVNDATGLLEVTLEKVIRAEEAEKKLDRAVRQGLIKRYHGVDWIGDALKKDIITESEAQLLRDVEALTARVIAVDHFDPAELRPELHDSRATTRAPRRQPSSTHGIGPMGLMPTRTSPRIDERAPRRQRRRHAGEAAQQPAAGVGGVDDGVDLEEARHVDRAALLVVLGDEFLEQRVALFRPACGLELLAITEPHGAFEAHAAVFRRRPPHDEQSARGSRRPPCPWRRGHSPCAGRP